MKKITEKRDQGLDLFRVVCMLMVVCMHYLGHGGVIDSCAFGDPNWYAANLIISICMVAVDGFVLISGYFLCTSKFRLSKWVSVYVQTLCYSLGIYLFFTVTGLRTFLWRDLVTSAMVLTQEQYWFITAYLLMLAVSPFLNKVIQAMDQKEHLLCCGILILFFSLLDTIVIFSDLGDISGGKSFLWFCVLYMIAAYIRYYVPAERVRADKAFLIYLCGVLVLFGKRYLMYWSAPKLHSEAVYLFLSNRDNSIVCLTASIALFLMFRKIQIRRRPIQKIVATVAPLSFAVYLIHDHGIMRYALWAVVKPFEYADLPWSILHMIICVTGIFTVCCAVEWVRRSLFRKLGIDSGLQKMSQWITAQTDKLLDRIIARSKTEI